MKDLFGLFGSRIKNKLALLSVIPVAVVTVIITWHTIETSREQIRTTQVKIATQLAGNLATISDFALYSGRQDLLQPLADSAAEMPGIANILFLTPDRKPLLTPILPDSVTPAMIGSGDYSGVSSHLMVIEEPVYLVDMEVTDFDDRDLSAAPLLGWVVVITDNTAALTNTQETIIVHLLISLSVLLGAVLLSFVLSNHVVSPIADITHTVRELERGNLQARIVPTTGDELAILANGINHLARTVAEGRENMEHKIDLATNRLRKTLEDLQLKNRELEAARREAENASTAKSEFLAQMSHEVRTPITAIEGFVNLLTATALKPSQARYCEIIQQAAGQLLQLIDDILDITRLQSSAMELDTAPFNLADCVEGPLSLMAPNAHEKGLELILDVSPNVPDQFVGDSLRIRQIIYNLVSNAIKFTPSGFVYLNVSVKNLHGAHLDLVLQVADTGIGIPDKDRAKLFDPFSQADNSISRRFGGSGLGLSIVKRLVTLMNGTLNLESTAGRGSCFTIVLPLELHRDKPSAPAPTVSSVLLYDSFLESRQALEHRLLRYATVIESCENFSDMEIDDNRRPPEAIIYSAPLSLSPVQLEAEVTRLRSLYACPITVLTPASALQRQLSGDIVDRLQPIHFIDRPPLSKELALICSGVPQPWETPPAPVSTSLHATILITEDNEFTRLLLATMFENSQCELVLATNGQEAIDACHRQRFDLVLMDVHMPEVNGLCALREIRTGSGPNKHTPVIMLTADILQQEENALFDAGASDLLFKPIDEQKLLNCVEKHLKAPFREESAERPPEERKHAQRKLFVEEVLRLSETAREALTEKDDELLRETTHQLLGIAGVYRMIYLERAVKALHKAIKTGNSNTLHAAMETLGHEIDKLSAENAAEERGAPEPDPGR